MPPGFNRTHGPVRAPRQKQPLESIDNINTLAPLLSHAHAPVPRPSRPQPRTPPPVGAAGTAHGLDQELRNQGLKIATLNEEKELHAAVMTV